MTKHNDPFESLGVIRSTLDMQIAERIEALVAAESLRPGDVLPSERDLAVRLGVSRNTVRSAILSLKERGLLVVKPGSGTYISAIADDVLSDSVERYCVFGSCSHDDLLALREMLEPGLAAQAAEHATEDELTRMGALIDKIEATFLGEDFPAHAEADTSFHMAIAHAARNELVMAIMGGLQRVMRVWLENQTRMTPSEGGARSHRSVYEAIASRDPGGAREAMSRHMVWARKSATKKK
jgi:GntR family transcriptional repressor for pyruvate dehydrogenase complex